jgi:ATP synthase protein I
MSAGKGPWPLFGALAGIGLAWACAIVLGYFLGLWLDRRLGSVPWLMLAGLVAGSAAGFVQFFRLLRRFDR